MGGLSDYAHVRPHQPMTNELILLAQWLVRRKLICASLVQLRELAAFRLRALSVLRSVGLYATFHSGKSRYLLFFRRNETCPIVHTI